MGPLTCIEYLSIVLDTDKLEARLPANKVERICKFIISIIQKSTCTKRELLQLLGHLNFASRVIVPGRSCVSYLIKLSTKVKELHFYVNLRKEARVDLDKYIDCLIETTCIVAFFAFLRCEEFTVMNVDKFDPLTKLCIFDFILKTDYAILRLKESKTDPFRKGIDIKLFKIDHSICPFLALKRYLSIRHSVFGIGFPSDPLFITGNREALTRPFFLVKFKNILELCGYDPNLYNGHSFRSGAATSAGKARVEDHMIKVLGRWKSDSYCRYIKISPTSIKYAQQSLTES
ncbi:Hypothetical predicted protein [Mytilus galloprovincialis]|uniref:Tyr recombinase domain-containing protein n=1 Tax=Mytilus galloprovincialis TaxID=29158 RepID=A0A8B6DL70_MYTGA|nr:Hypothetical predicted protein [Mytilus galloprovincialis]